MSKAEQWIITFELKIICVKSKSLCTWGYLCFVCSLCGHYLECPWLCESCLHSLGSPVFMFPLDKRDKKTQLSLLHACCSIFVAATVCLSPYPSFLCWCQYAHLCVFLFLQSFQRFYGRRVAGNACPSHHTANNFSTLF